MDKNWLIRTRSNHILGPISKEKVLELYHNGSIKPDDEVCSGNGYWFYVREDDLVQRFLLGDETQGFNPISEAKDVLTTGGTKHVAGPERDDITLVGQLNLAGVREAPADAARGPEPAAVEAVPPKIPDAAEAPGGGKKKTNAALKPRKAQAPRDPQPPKRQRWLVYAGAVGFLLLLLMIYFRKGIIQRIFRTDLSLATVSLVSSAHAQAPAAEKKKSF
jgi:hypothetical protein